MKELEARTYFSTLGKICTEQRTISPAAVTLFLKDERQEEEYNNALQVLKVIRGRNYKMYAEGEKQEVDSFLLENIDRVENAVDAYSPKAKSFGDAIEKIYSYSEFFTRYLNPIMNENEGNSKFRSTMHSTIHIGVWLASLNATRKMRAIVQEARLGSTAEAFVDATELIQAEPVLIQENGKTLADFAQVDFRKSSDGELMIDFMEMFIGFAKNRRHLDKESTEIDTEHWAFQKYPYLYRNYQLEAGDAVVGFYYLQPGDLERVAGELKFLGKYTIEMLGDIVNHSLAFNKNMIAFKSRLKQLAFDPQNPATDKIREALTVYLNHESQFIRAYILNMLGVWDEHSLKKLYREAEDVSHQSTNSQFYKLLTSRLEELLERSTINIPTVDDLELTIDSESQPLKLSSFAEQKALVSEIIKNPSWQKVATDDLEIDWKQAGIKPPLSWAFTMPPENPYQVTLHLYFEDEDSESVDYSVTLNTSKENIDWTALESPKYYQDLKQRYSATTFQILNQIAQKVKKLQSEKRSSPTSSPKSVSVPRQERIQNYTKPSKEIGNGQNQKKSTLFNQLLTKSRLPDLEESEIIETIEVPDAETLAKLTKDIPIEIQREAIQCMNDFNEGKSPKRLKPLRSTGPEGQKQAELRLGDYRIIITAESFTDKKKEYAFRYMKHRREVFRVYGMIKTL